MNATQLLKQDHQTMKRLFRDIERTRDSGKHRKRIFRQLRSEVETHSTVEEEIFYPAIFEQAESKLAALVGPAEEKLRKLKSLLGQISGLSPDDPRFDAKTSELRSCIKDHVEEEEGRMFPQARSTLGDRFLEEVGREIQERKEQLQQSVGQRLMGSVKALLLGESSDKGTGRRTGAPGRRAPALSAHPKARVARKSRSATKARGVKRSERGIKQAASSMKGRKRAARSERHTKARAGHRARSRRQRSSGR